MLKLASPAHPSLSKGVFGISHSTLIFLPQFSSSSPLSQSFSPSHLQDSGIHWVEWAPQLISFVRHVLISVDDIQSQKSLQTHQCKVAAPVLRGRGTPVTQRPGTLMKFDLLLEVWVDPLPAPLLRSHANLCYLAVHLRALTVFLLQGSVLCSVLAFVLLGIVGLIGWPPPWPLFICWLSSGAPRYLIPTSWKARWPNTHEVFLLDSFTGLLRILL